MGFSCKFSLKPYLHFHVYRKTPYLMGKSMVSCRFSLKPIHWVVPRVCSTSMSQLSHAVAEAPSQGTIPRRVPRRGLWASKRFQDGWNTKQNLQTLSWLIYFQYFLIISIHVPYVSHTFSIRFPYVSIFLSWRHFVLQMVMSCRCRRIKGVTWDGGRLRMGESFYA